MGFDPPRVPAASPDERQVLLGCAAWQREQVVATAGGLTEEDLRWTPDGRLLSIIGIINHLAHMEWRWVEGRYLRSEFPDREDEFCVPEQVTGAHVIEAYWQQAQRTERIVREAPNLEVPCLGEERGGGAVLVDGAPVDLRWVLLHLIEEIAHHAGHADSTREMLDGTKMRA